jgi:hypothetical protein
MINQPETGDKVLGLLRQFGWETGLRKLREELSAASDAEARNNMLFFAGWMAAERGPMTRRSRYSGMPERTRRPGNGRDSSRRSSRYDSNNSARRGRCSARSSRMRRAFSFALRSPICADQSPFTPATSIAP